MLHIFRAQFGTWLLAIVMIVIGVPMIFWGVDFKSGGRQTVLSVNGKEVPISGLQKDYHGALQRLSEYYPEGVPELLNQQVRQSVVDEAVNNTVLDQQAADYQLAIGDEALRDNIVASEVFQVDSKFSQSRYEQYLQASGYSPALYEQRLRRALEVTQLADGISRSAFITPTELERRAALDGERREVAWLEFSPERYKTDIKVSADEVAEYFSAHEKEWIVPETVSVEYVQTSPNDYAESIAINEDELLAFYEQEKTSGRFQDPEKRQARHILLKLDADAPATEADSKRGQAEEIIKRLDAGEEFDALAGALSDDPGSAKQGGDLGWAARTAFVGPFADAVFAMKEGEIRGPVRSEFGWHVIRLDGIQPAESKDFERVRDDLAEELRGRRAAEHFSEIAAQLDELAYESEASLAPIAQTMNLPIRSLHGITREAGNNIAAEARVREAIFAPQVLSGDANSRALELSDGSIVVLHVSQRDAPRQQALEEVKNVVTAKLVQERATQRAQQQASEALTALTGKQALGDVAKQWNAQVHEFSWIGRRADASVDLDSRFREAVFAATKPTTESPVIEQAELSDGAFVVYYLRAVQPGLNIDPVKQLQARQSQGRDELGVYVAALRETASVEMNLDLLQ